MARPADPARRRERPDGRHPSAPRSTPTDARGAVSVASQWQLIWWRFRKHRSQVGGRRRATLLLRRRIRRLLRLLGPVRIGNAKRALLPPQPIHLFDEWLSSRTSTRYAASATPHIPARVCRGPDRRRLPPPVREGYDVHVSRAASGPTSISSAPIGTPAEGNLFVLGADLQGRDLYSRLMYARRPRCLIGLLGVSLSLVLGVCSVVSPATTAGRRYGDPAAHRDPPLDPGDPAVDGPRGGDAARLERPAGLLRDHDHPLPDRLDRARACRPRPDHRAPQRGLREGRRAGRRRPRAYHLRPYGAVVRSATSSRRRRSRSRR